MTGFIQKKLPTTKSLPEIIKEERQKHGLTVEQLSFKTKISVKYLEAFEKGHYQLLPGEVYTKQFIKNLAKLFHLNEKNLQNIYQKEKKSQPTLININRHPKKELKTGHWLSPKSIRNFLIVLIIIAFSSYFGFEIKNIFTPPSLEIIGKTCPGDIISFFNTFFFVATLIVFALS